MNPITIYVGKTDRQLVLKYPVGFDRKELCHFYPIDEKSSDTVFYLRLKFGDKRKLEFEPLDDPEHRIRPVEKKHLNELSRLCA